MSLKRELLRLAQLPGANLSELCRRFGLSRKTAYKWLKRYRQEGEAGLEDRSRRPRSCPHQTAAPLEKKIRSLRRQHPTWGGRKIRHKLRQRGVKKVPAASTVTRVLQRLHLIEPAESARHRPCQRFERAQPNELLQMDFKGDFPTLSARCYPLTLLDDHSRFLLGLFACADQRLETVQAHLQHVFRQYGLPQALLMDNGSPWGGCETCAHTRLTVFLLRLGIRVLHGRVRHPQTQGKVERLHGTLQRDLIGRESFVDLEHCQRRLDHWREIYNWERPHEALQMKVPGDFYTPSPLPYPETLPPVEYDESQEVRKVQSDGRISYRGRLYRIGRAFVGLPVALQATEAEGVMEVYFCRQCIKTLDGRDSQTSGGLDESSNRA